MKVMKREKVSLTLPRMGKELVNEVELKEKAMLFLDILTQIETKREEIGDKNSWLAVSRNMKVELLGYRYAYILQFLIARKIVRVYHGKNGTEYYRQGGYQRKADGSYEKTSDGSYGQCKIYRLTEKYSKLVRRGKVKCTGSASIGKS
jgi:hypothetical protein